MRKEQPRLRTLRTPLPAQTFLGRQRRGVELGVGGLECRRGGAAAGLVGGVPWVRGTPVLLGELLGEAGASCSFSLVPPMMVLFLDKPYTIITPSSREFLPRLVRVVPGCAQRRQED